MNIAKIKSNFDTFTIGYSDYLMDESHDAKNISKFLNTNHHEIILDDKNITDSINDILNSFEEPFLMHLKYQHL